MGFLDHLFKPKPNEEKMREGERERDAAAATGGDGEIPAAGPDPGAFLQPKDFVQRGGGTIYPPTRPVAPAGRKPLAEERRREIVITLGDVLSRIPTQLLRAGFHDEKRELRFSMDDLSADIARGRAAVSLSRIAALCPDVFSREIAPEDDSEIRLPLQKLVEQIGLLRGRSAKPPAVDGLPVVPGSASAMDLPPFSESAFAVRITLAAAPIERQFDNDQMEVSARRFVSVQPPALQSFEPRDGVKVPLPGEEILENPPDPSEPADGAAPTPPDEAAPPSDEPLIPAPPPLPVFIPTLRSVVIVPAGSPESDGHQREPDPVASSDSATAAQALPSATPPPAAMPPSEEPRHATENPALSESAPAPAGIRIHPPPMVRPMIVHPPPILGASSAPAEASPVQTDTDQTLPPASAIAEPRNFDVLQPLFMTDESLDLAAVCRHAAGLPGVAACALVRRGATAVGGELPEGFDLAALHLVAARMSDAASAAGPLPLGALQNFTLHGHQAAISLFTRPGLLLAVLHRALPPGVRERLAAVTDELARP